MKIVVLVKFVPEPSAAWTFAGDLTLDRGAVEGRLSELDEYAVEQAVRMVEAGADATITYLTVGPARAVDGLRKALAIGGDDAVHVLDDAMHGSCALSTSRVLAAALEKTGYDLVLTGMASTDAEMSVMASMLAERLGINQATFAGDLALEGDGVTIRREAETESLTAHTALPAVVSVTDQTPEARYPAFKAIMGAKKKPLTTYSLADLGVDPALVGASAASSRVLSVDKAPPRTAGEVLADDGTGGERIAQFLGARGLL